MLISVDLPAPLVPITACTRAALQVERHAVHRHQAAEAARERRGAQQHVGVIAVALLSSRAACARPARQRRPAPISPRGSSATLTMMVRPSPSCQCLAKAPKIASDLKNSCSSANAKAPITAPRRWPRPPRMIMISTAPEKCQLSSSGLTKPSFTANRKPPSPAMRARHHEGGQLVRVGREAGGAHALLVDADARQRAPEARTLQQREEAEHQPPGRRARSSTARAARRGRAGQLPSRATGLTYEVDAVGAAAERRVVHHVVGHLREGQRHHDEVDALGAQRQRAHEERVGRSHRHRTPAAATAARPASPSGDSFTAA